MFPAITWDEKLNFSSLSLFLISLAPQLLPTFIYNSACFYTQIHKWHTSAAVIHPPSLSLWISPSRGHDTAPCIHRATDFPCKNQDPFFFFMSPYQKPTKASLSHCTLLQLFPFLFELNHTMAKLKSLAHAVYSDWWKRSNESLPHHPACTWAQSLLLYLCVQRPCSKTHIKQQSHQV